MSPELAGLFQQASGMAPAVPADHINRMREAVEVELARKDQEIERLNAANQILAEQLKSRTASQFGPKSESKARSTSADARPEKDDQSEDEEGSGAPKKTSRPKSARHYEGKKPNHFLPNSSG